MTPVTLVFVSTCAHPCSPTTACPQHGHHPGPPEMWVPPQPPQASGTPPGVTPAPRGTAGATEGVWGDMRGGNRNTGAGLGGWGPQALRPMPLRPWGSLWVQGLIPAVPPEVGGYGGVSRCSCALSPPCLCPPMPHSMFLCHIPKFPPFLSPLCPTACPSHAPIPHGSPQRRADNEWCQHMLGTLWGGGTWGTQVTLGHRGGQ